jgi:O-antigen ligase
MNNSGAIAGIASFSHVESAQSDSLLAGAVGFFLSARIIFALVSAKWLNIGSEPGVAAAFGAASLLLLLASLQACGAGARPLGWAWNIPSMRWIVAYLAFSCCSLVWTAAVSRAASSLYWCALLFDVITVLALFRGHDVGTAAHSLMKGFIWGSSALAAIAWMMPAADDLRLGDLDYFNTNQIGNLCALAVFLSNLLGQREHGRWRLPALFLTVTLIRSLSKSTLVAFAAAHAYRLLRDSGTSRAKKVMLLLGGLVVLAAFWGLLDAYYGVYTTAGNQAETLTGRTAIWAWAMQAAVRSPWIGNGIDAMWKVMPPFGPDMFEARHAENELLQQFFAYGAVGVVMLVGIYRSLWRRFRSVKNESAQATLKALLIFVWIRGLAEAEPFDLLLPLWLITTLVLLVERSPFQVRRAQTAWSRGPIVDDAGAVRRPA